MSAFTCPHCKQQIDIAESDAGQVVQCTLCNGELRVPGTASGPVRSTPDSTVPPPPAGYGQSQQNAPAGQSSKSPTTCLVVGAVVAVVAVLMIFVMGILAAIMLPAIAQVRRCPAFFGSCSSLRQEDLEHADE